MRSSKGLSKNAYLIEYTLKNPTNGARAFRLSEIIYIGTYPHSYLPAFRIAGRSLRKSFGEYCSKKCRSPHSLYSSRKSIREDDSVKHYPDERSFFGARLGCGA